MPDYFEQPTKADKIVPAICLIILLAFFACLPAMIRGENRYKEQLWQDQGCQMYDNTKSIEIPAKCSNIFTDHYRPQQERIQPPEVKR